MSYKLNYAVISALFIRTDILFLKLPLISFSDFPTKYFLTCSVDIIWGIINIIYYNQYIIKKIGPSFLYYYINTGQNNKYENIGISCILSIVISKLNSVLPEYLFNKKVTLNILPTFSQPTFSSKRS